MNSPDRAKTGHNPNSRPLLEFVTLFVTLKAVERKVQAVYENGILRPLEPLTLEECQQVTITISDAPGITPEHPLLLSPDEWLDAANDDVGRDEVRAALATIRGSLSEAILEERRDR